MAHDQQVIKWVQVQQQPMNVTPAQTWHSHIYTTLVIIIIWENKLFESNRICRCHVGVHHVHLWSNVLVLHRRQQIWKK